MYYTSKTPKIGALLIAFETAEKNAATEEMKNEIRAAFQSAMISFIPYKLVGVIYEEDGSAKLGIFQSSDVRDKWLRSAKRKKLKTEKGNGYNLQPTYHANFGIDYNKITGREISEDLSQVIYTISN